jgi:hypothetical protein
VLETIFPKVIIKDLSEHIILLDRRVMSKLKLQHLKAFTVSFNDALSFIKESQLCYIVMGISQILSFDAVEVHTASFLELGLS